MPDVEITMWCGKKVMTPDDHPMFKPVSELRELITPEERIKMLQDRLAGLSLSAGRVRRRYEEELWDLLDKTSSVIAER